MGKRAGYDLTLSFDTFGTLLHYLRRRARLTQQQLGIAVGYSTPQISMLENGQRLPDLTALAALFIPALDLNDEPELAKRLLQLAADMRSTREHIREHIREHAPAAHPPRRKPLPVQGDVLDERATPPAYHLPAPVLPLIGREGDLAAGLSRLLDPGVRLLTLVGPPGVGKTRLALQLAWDVRDLFRDGVAYVELAALTDPALVSAAVSQTLQLGAGSADLPAALREKQLLLVLDNFEQVLPAASFVAELLALAPSLKVLVTSREALRIYGEHEYAVSPLGLPDLARLPDVEELAQYPAVKLFVARAQAAHDGFALTVANALAVAAVCIQLDGLPLALELAAAQMKLLSAQELAARLVERLRLPMQQRARNLPGRHRSLRDAIDWSYLLLDASQQRLFAQLGVFTGGFDLAAAQAIHHLDPLEGSRLLEGNRLSLISNLQSLKSLSTNDVTSSLLQSLIDKSLVQMVPATAPARFTLLETLREYAMERLSAMCDEAVYQRHAAYFLALAEGVNTPADNPHTLGGLERLARDYDNLRTAAHWLLVHDAIGALRLCIMLAPFWQRYGYYAEGRHLLLQALTRAGDDAPMELRAQGAMEASALAQRQEDAPEALRLAEISLSLYRALGNRRGMAQALRERGWASFQAHDRLAAAQHFQASLALYRELDDKPSIADALTSLAHVTHQPGVNDAQVNELLQESLAIQRDLGLTLAEGRTLEELGYVESCMGHPETAEARYTEALAIFSTAGTRHDMAWTQCALGEAAWHQGQLDKAERYYRECQRAFEELGTPSGVTIVLHHLAQVQRKRGRLDEAERLYAESLRQSTEQANERMVARCLAGLGGVALARGQVERARQLMLQAFALFARLPPFLAPADRSEYESWLAIP